MVEFTKRQKETLTEIPKDTRSYQRLVYRKALKLHELIKDEPTERLKIVLDDFEELTNNDMRSTGLSKPIEQFDSAALDLYKTLDRQNHSTYSFSCTVNELRRIVEDYKAAGNNCT